jgi:hypothetical protein
MGISLASFESSPIPPNPTALEIKAVGTLGAQGPKPDRAALINSIGALMGVPPSGWAAGQSRLFEKGEARVFFLLRRLAQDGAADAVANNVERVTKYVHVDMMLAITSAARESSSSITAQGSKTIESFKQGGLDHLWPQRNQLSLPASITSTWKEVPPYESAETHRLVFPAEIPARDQLLAYAAQMSASYNNNTRKVDDWLRTKGIAASTCCRVAALVWKAYAFLAPGGKEYNASKTFESQAGRPFGVFTASTYVASAAPIPAIGPNYLNRILVDVELNKIEWVRIAKARVTEALLLEHWLREARLHLP